MDAPVLAALVCVDGTTPLVGNVDGAALAAEVGFDVPAADATALEAALACVGEISLAKDNKIDISLEIAANSGFTLAAPATLI